jgi:copper(I)-binding protein
MMKIFQCALAILCLSLSLLATAASGDIAISKGWIRWLPSDLPAAGYLRIDNRGDKPINLLRASSPDYKSVMIHRSMNTDGMSHMEMLDHLRIPAHGTVDISPGSYHLMLSHALHPIAPGAKVPLSLQFSDGSVVHTQLIVRPANQVN